MKKVVTTLFALIVLASVGAYFYYSSNGFTEEFSIKSPLPELLTRGFSKTQVSAEAWRPRIDKVVTNGITEPEINSAAAISYDLTHNKLLFSQNIEKRLPMASLTKIMTAIIAIENMELETEIEIDKYAATIGEGTMSLEEGEVLKLEDLLYGLLLQSGNDAAEAIASSSKFGRENFVYLMNKKAEELGLTDTRFTNPSGLEGDGDQYSTPHDLVVMTRYALQNPTFSEIVKTYQHDIEQNEKHKAFQLFNETNLLTSYPGVRGVKTGYTEEAGMCLVTYLDYNGHKIIAILLNAQNRREEMKNILDYSLKTLGVNPPPHS